MPKYKFFLKHLTFDAINCVTLCKYTEFPNDTHEYDMCTHILPHDKYLHEKEHSKVEHHKVI